MEEFTCKYCNITKFRKMPDLTRRIKCRICERNRVNELYIGLGNRPIICIRFNPDKYNENSNSCFNYSPKIHKISLNKKECHKRLNKVIEEIIKYSNVEITEPYKEIKLFIKK